MKRYIDARYCCQDGLSIVWDKCKAGEARDRRAMNKLLELEAEHLQKCTTCNPDLLLEALFGKEVTVTDEPSQNTLF